MEQIRREWRVDRWLVTVNSQKAIGSIHHDARWRSLRKQSISEQDISLLMKLYDGQTATVLTDAESESLRISTVTKQGSLVICVIQFGTAVRDGKWYRVLEGEGEALESKWKMKKKSPVSQIWDLLMMCFSWQTRWDRSNLMTDFSRSTDRKGFKSHANKTKILPNEESNRQREVKIDDIKAEILLPQEKVKYLGQVISFYAPRNILKSRVEFIAFGKHLPDIDKSWRPSHICSAYSNSIITPVITHGAAT